jgi:hypothetical protein
VSSVHEDSGPGVISDPVPDSARLPLVLLIAIGTAALFHLVFWLLWTYVRGLV